MGGARHADGKIEVDVNEDEDDYTLEQVIRLEDQPKCITGGRMRDYQACHSTVPSFSLCLIPHAMYPRPAPA